MRGLHDFFYKGKEYRNLFLNQNKITNEGFNTLMRNLQSSKIETLDLSNNRISKEGMLECLSFFKGTKIRTVNFKYNIVEANEKTKVISEYRKKDILVEI